MNNVTIDSKQVDTVLNKLSDDEVKRNIIFKAIYAGAKELQQITRSYFKNALGDAATHISKYIKAPFYEGITVKGEKAYIEARVSIMKDFRLKFFEKGTVDRYIKQSGHSNYSRKKKRNVKNTGKANYRGRITGLNYFKNARENSQSYIETVIHKSIQNSLNKL